MSNLVWCCSGCWRENGTTKSCCVHSNSDCGHLDDAAGTTGRGVPGIFLSTATESPALNAPLLVTPLTSARATSAGLLPRVTGKRCKYERAVYSRLEKSVLRKFRQFLMTPGQMLCFFGADLHRHKAALRTLTEKRLLDQEQFSGAYSLTRAGFEAMKACESEASLTITTRIVDQSDY
jgi:hypothetical protein